MFLYLHGNKERLKEYIDEHKKWFYSIILTYSKSKPCKPSREMYYYAAAV